MRIALYGFIEEHAGSLASANFLLLRELLDRGHEVDLFAIKNFITPGRLAAHPNLRYLPVHCRAFDPIWRWIEYLPGRFVRRAFRHACSQVTLTHIYPQLGRWIAAEHRRRRYDALLVVGLLSPWQVAGLRTVSWSQGTPNGEWTWLAAHARDMVRHRCGQLLPFLAANYAYRYFTARRDLPRSDVLICASRWEAQAWRAFGVPARKLIPLPYPFDLTAFAPAPQPADKPPDEFLFLHLGRIVPRKRLDLLLAGFALVAADEPLARLTIVGGFGYGEGYRRQLRDPALTRNVEYRPAVPRTQVADLLARADAVVQSSENENFGSAVAEAQASGRPVLVGPTNGTKDYIAPSSVVFERYTPEAVAAGMRELIRRVRADRAGMAAESRRAAEQHLAIGPVTDALEAVLRNDAPL